MENHTEISEDEKNVDTELEGHGVVEPGMSLEDKKSLLAVLKMSESTALAEEHSRVSLKNSPPRTQIQHDANNVNNVFKQNQEVTTLEALPTENVSSDKPYPVTTLSIDCDSDESESSKSKKLISSTPKFTPRSSKLSLKSKIVVVNDEAFDEDPQSTSNLPNSNTSQLPDILETEKKSECNNKREETFYLKNDLPQRKLFPKEDRKRNINVFSLEEDLNEHPMTVSKQRKVNGKVPYYFVPHGMNLKDFTVHFKQQLNVIGKNLVLTQRRSLNLVPWGNPVVVGKIEKSNDTFESICGNADVDNTATLASQNQRYNFRGRSNLSKRKCEDDIFSHISEEDSSSDDLFFAKKVDTDSTSLKSNPYKGATKRKPIVSAVVENLEESDVNLFTENKPTGTLNAVILSTENRNSSSDDEHLADGKDSEKKTSNVTGILKKKQPCTNSAGEKLLIDSSEDEFIVENDIPGKRIQMPKTKLLFTSTNNKRKKVSKPVRNVENKEEIQRTPKVNTSLWLSTTSCNEPQEDVTIIKPMPMKMRKLGPSNSSTSNQRRKGLKRRDCQEVDEIVVPDECEENNKSKEVIVGIACPICKVMFHGNDIQDHASECIGFEDGVAVVPDGNFISRIRCPICQDHFPAGSSFDRHAQHCTVTRRLVRPPPPTGRGSHNQN